MVQECHPEKEGGSCRQECTVPSNVQRAWKMASQGLQKVVIGVPRSTKSNLRLLILRDRNKKSSPATLHSNEAIVMSQEA